MAIDDSDPDADSGTPPETIWVTVADAATKSGVDTGTVRQWYRSGRLPTQRSQGDRGSFLVPLDAVVALARGDKEGDALVADLIDLNAAYWSAQTEAAREETTAARNELAVVREQLETVSRELEHANRELGADREQLAFLRSQLAEASEDARQLRDRLKIAERERDGLRAEEASLRAELGDAREELDRTNDELGDSRSRLSALEAELDKLRAISSATGSITDNSWLALPTNTYRSPVRPQGMAAATPAGTALAGLLADTTPDPDDASGADLAMPVLDDERPPASAVEDGPEVAAALAPEPPDGATDEAPPAAPPPARRVKPVFGVHDDDLLPQPEKKGRRGRR